MANKKRLSDDLVERNFKRLAQIRQATIHNLVGAYRDAAGKVSETASKTLKQNDDLYRRKKVRTDRLDGVEINITNSNKKRKKKKPAFVTVNPEKHNPQLRDALKSGRRLSLQNLTKVMNNKVVKEDIDLEESRRAAGPGERLLRAQSLRSVGQRIGQKTSPPTLEKTLKRRAQRSARYALRKKLAPNYDTLSTGQKQDIDERIRRHPELDHMVGEYMKKYRAKYARKQTGKL